MKKFVLAFAALAVTASAPALAQPGKGHGAHKAGKHQRQGGSLLGGLAGQSHCPPGLAKKNNGCLPPGQAKKYGIGQRLPSYLSAYNVPERYRDRYYDTRDYNYRYEGDHIYRVNRRSGLIDEVISILGL